MRLLSLDYDPIYGEESTRSRFASDTSAFDYDAVIWDPKATLDFYCQSTYSIFRGLPSLGDSKSVAIKADIERRREEFKEFVESGRVLMVIVRPPQECYIETGRTEVSGTGRNQSRTLIVDRINLWSAIPFSQLSTTIASGNRISLRGDNPLASFLRTNKQLLRYDAVLSWPQGTPLALITGTSRVVSSFARIKGGGLVAFLPPLQLRADVDSQRKWGGDTDEEDPDDETGDETDDDQFIDDAFAVHQGLMHALETMTSKTTRARPPWSARYETADQAKLRDELLKQESRVEAARKRLSKLIEQRDKVDAKNQLYLGTGDVLAAEVKVVFEMLGGEVTQPDPERDDWRVEFPNGNAVIEVKGVLKSAAEKHAAQLEKWVAGEFEETGIAPKGILVINTWREVDLRERIDADFPDQMIPYCTGRGHCLITGLQLFCIRMEVESDASRAAFWRAKIFETSGVLDGVGDWRCHLISTDHDSAVGSTDGGSAVDDNSS